MNRKTTYLSALVFLACASTPNAYAQSGNRTLTPEIIACADEKDVLQRLSCYDRAVEAYRVAIDALAPPAPEANSAPAAAVAAPAPAAEIAPPAATAAPAPVADVLPDVIESTPAPASSPTEDDFGRNRGPEEITAVVAEIRERPYGELVIRLDNGQIWEQKHLDQRFRLRVGETVTIKRGAVSGYRLSGSSNRSIQVTRLR